MKVFDANIPAQVEGYLKKNLQKSVSFDEANERVRKACGINFFFDNQTEFEALKEIILETVTIAEEPDRAEYGDFQTNIGLAIEVASFLKKDSSRPKVIVEPSCGKGNFIIASLQTFDSIETIIGVEIYKPYVWETKFNILQFFIDNPTASKPDISIFHFNVFDFDFRQFADKFSRDEILIIGNPPWVTNSKLSSLESSNLPVKSNFKNHSGLDAMTGKGNFDIGEYIILMMFDAFQHSSGRIAFLVKNSVIKNVVFDQKQRNYYISDFRKYSIDSKKEFNVSVDASLFTGKLNTSPAYDCKEFDFYNNSIYSNIFGWVNEKYVSNTVFYELAFDIDGRCPFEWRQGVKHDCSAIMEFGKVNGHYENGLNQEIALEEELVYGMLKSSDLKQPVIDKTRKFTIITQKKVGQETTFIKEKFPKTFFYLSSNRSVFDARKSSIYRDKPAFSIFGIGDYSFKPYKVSISGLYKTYSFNLILPQNGKPIMLDDTCYFIGFDRLDFAAFTQILLNSEKARAFLQSVTFADAKRTFTKDILMRIDLLKLASTFTNLELQKNLDSLNQSFKLSISAEAWHEFVKILSPASSGQMSLFKDDLRHGNYIL